jgi:uncharacterized membrane-anchored protein YitT (DUF2179 family)
MRKFWNSFRNEIKEYTKSVIEWLFYIAVFSIISIVAYDGNDTAFATMVASYAMLLSISNHRKLSRVE